MLWRGHYHKDFPRGRIVLQEAFLEDRMFLRVITVSSSQYIIKYGDLTRGREITWHNPFWQRTETS
jgi:hypothetical protein